MKIAEIDVFQHDLPVRGPEKGVPYRMALQDVWHLDTTIVRLACDDGTVGYGETCPLGSTYQPEHALGARAALAEVVPHLIGLDPTAVGRVNSAMDEALMGHRYAKAAVDVACWDATGKAYGVRVCDLLGGAVRERVPSYHGVLIASPEDSAADADRRQAEGFPRIQLKVGGRPVAEDVAALRAVAAILRPGVRLSADANKGWTTRDAIQVSRACRDLAMVLEQPCQTYEETASLVGKVCHPIYLDESATDLTAVVTAIGQRVADGFGMKVSRVGGISAMRAVRDVCAAARRPHTVDDTWGGDLVAAASLHVGATVDPTNFEGTWIAEPYVDGHYDDEHGIHLDGGWIDLPPGPGLGITPDESQWGDPMMSFR